LVLDEICNAIREGLEERKNMKSTDKDEVAEAAPVAEATSEDSAE